MHNLIYDVSVVGSVAIIKTNKFKLHWLTSCYRPHKASSPSMYLSTNRIDSKTSNVANRSNYFSRWNFFGLLWSFGKFLCFHRRAEAKCHRRRLRKIEQVIWTCCTTRLEICIYYVITRDDKQGAAIRRFEDTKISRSAKLNTVTVLIKVRRQPAYLEIWVWIGISVVLIAWYFTQQYFISTIVPSPHE